METVTCIAPPVLGASALVALIGLGLTALIWVAYELLKQRRTERHYHALVVERLREYRAPRSSRAWTATDAARPVTRVAAKDRAVSPALLEEGASWRELVATRGGVAVRAG